MNSIWLTQNAQSAAIPFLAGLDSNIMLMLILGTVWVFMYILPMNKAKKKRNALIANIKKGDRVIMESGIIGKISAVKEQEVVVETGESKISFARHTIANIYGQEDNKTA